MTTKTVCTALHFRSLWRSEYERTITQSYANVKLVILNLWGNKLVMTSMVNLHFSFFNLCLQSSWCLSYVHKNWKSELKLWQCECHCENANPIPITFIPIHINISVPISWESHGTHEIPVIPIPIPCTPLVHNITTSWQFSPALFSSFLSRRCEWTFILCLCHVRDTSKWLLTIIISQSLCTTPTDTYGI